MTYNKDKTYVLYNYEPVETTWSFKDIGFDIPLNRVKENFLCIWSHMKWRRNQMLGCQACAYEVSSTQR